jgi:hypothetical protein
LDDGHHSAVKLQLGGVDFGEANVCPSGKTTPAPCSQTTSLFFQFSGAGSLGKLPSLVTEGGAGLNFADAGTSGALQSTKAELSRLRPLMGGRS